MALPKAAPSDVRALGVAVSIRAVGHGWSWNNQVAMHQVTRQRPFTVRQWLRYRFDNTMSRGPIALIGWLAAVSVALIFLITLLVLIFGIGPKDDVGTSLGFFDTMWYGLMRTLDAGTMGGDSGSWPFLFAMLGVTLGGIFIVSTLIGVLSSGIEEKLDELRKGRSFVVESNHTVILGWNPQVFSIISELVIANENQKRPVIAILADEDKVEMEDAIRTRVPETGRTRIVCRSGNPMDLADLEIINPRAARSVVVLAPPVDDPDSHVIKTILALTNGTNRDSSSYHVIAEIRDGRNLDVARMVGRDRVELVMASDLISRIAVQTSRQSGLSVVYTELLDFSGDEIYFHEEPGLAGRTFGDALMAFEDSSVIGLRYASGVTSGARGQVHLNPPADTPISTGDRLIAISRDDDTIRLSGIAAPPVDEAAMRAPRQTVPAPERSLILGWNRRVPTIVNELDTYVAPGSEVLIIAESTGAEEIIARDCTALGQLTVRVQHGDTTDRRLLEALRVHEFQHLIVLGYSDTLGPQEADAKTLITLLHLRDMAERGGHEFSIVSEMLDLRNRELAEVTRADDFIVSDKLVSLLFAQIAENRELALVFDDLFDSDGVELYLKPADDYVEPGQPVTYYTVVEAARRRDEVAIGYRLKSGAGDAASSYGVVVNPKKSDRVTFTAADRIIVLADN